MSESNKKIKKFELPDDIKNALESIKINIPKVEFDYESFYKASENIGKLGWTIPFSFTPAETDLFADENLTTEDINTFFMGYYSEDNNFKRMISTILSINEIQQWHLAIEQCVFAHKNNKFILSISTLIPVLEGILSTFENDKTNIRMIKVCNGMLASTDEKKSLVDKIVWTSCYHFISALYAKSDFSGEEPEIINRHWILHGRTAFNNSEIDSIRLFNAIETVSNIMKYHKRKQSRNN